MGEKKAVKVSINDNKWDTNKSPAPWACNCATDIPRHKK